MGGQVKGYKIMYYPHCACKVIEGEENGMSGQ